MTQNRQAVNSTETTPAKTISTLKNKNKLVLIIDFLLYFINENQVIG
jgi:hypothetical protein